MSQISFGGVQFTTQEAREALPTDEQLPLRIAVLGDFSGRAAQGLKGSASAIASRQPIEIDRDNLDETMQKMHVQLAHALVAGDRSVTVPFRSLEDFHPDQLFNQVSLFQSLRETRRRLTRDETFAEAAEEVRSWSGIPAERAEAAGGATPSPKLDVDSASLLQQILDQSQPPDSTPAAHPASVDATAVLRQAVEPYLVASNPQQAQLIQCVDQAIGALMRSLLHHARFQQLEAVWRGLDLLVRRLETGPHLKILLLDISKDELLTDLLSKDELRATGLHRLLVEQSVGTPGAQPWSLLVGLYAFDASEVDTSALAKLGEIARLASAPWIAAAQGSIVGCTEPERQHDPDDWQMAGAGYSTKTWRDLRQQPSSGFIGLVWPAFLLRLPFGSETEPIEAFEFEEFEAGRVGRPAPTAQGTLSTQGTSSGHGDYLWGNPALVVATLIGQSFVQFGWRFQLGQIHQLDGLPLYITEQDGAKMARPCGEVALNERGMEHVVAAGLMPLLSLKNQDRIQIGRFQSLQGKPLPGRWG